MQSDKSLNIYSLVLSGGGVKGIAFIGALKALQNNQMLQKFQNFAGTSIGSLVILFYLVGYEPDEIWNFIYQFDFSQVSKLDVLDLFESYGIDDGNGMKEVIVNLIGKKIDNPYITLEDLYLKTRCLFVITTTLLNTNSKEYLSYITYPKLPAVNAVMMSMAVPFYFKPVFYNGNYFVDGGISENYSMSLFDPERTLGLYITSKLKNLEISSFFGYLNSVIMTLMNTFSSLNTKGYEKNTIKLFCGDISMLDFNLSFEKRLSLFNLGFDKTNEFIKSNSLIF